MACDQISKEWPKFLHDGFCHFSGICEDQRGMCTDEVSDGLNVVFKHLHHRKVAEFWMRMRMSKSSSLEPEILAMDTEVGFPLASRSSLLTRYSATVSRGSMVAEIPMR